MSRSPKGKRSKRGGELILAWRVCATHWRNNTLGVAEDIDKICQWYRVIDQAVTWRISTCHKEAEQERIRCNGAKGKYVISNVFFSYCASLAHR